MYVNNIVIRRYFVCFQQYSHLRLIFMLSLVRPMRKTHISARKELIERSFHSYFFLAQHFPDLPFAVLFSKTFFSEVLCALKGKRDFDGNYNEMDTVCIFGIMFFVSYLSC